MVDLQNPPTRRRYLAELNNLLRIRARPVYINGIPPATIDQIHKFIGGRRLSDTELQLGNTVIVMYDDCTALFSIQ